MVLRTTCIIILQTLHNTSSEGSSKTTSEGNSKTSSNSTPSDPTFALMSLECSQSWSEDGVASTASDIKGCIVGVIHNIKGQGWSGSMGNANQ